MDIYNIKMNAFMD